MVSITFMVIITFMGDTHAIYYSQNMVPYSIVIWVSLTTSRRVKVTEVSLCEAKYN